MPNGSPAALSNLQRFLKLEAAGGIVLFAAAAAALILANSPLGWMYTRFLDIPLALQIDGLVLKSRCRCGSTTGCRACPTPCCRRSQRWAA
jgi:Na+/H+ antiporter NhaA